MLISYGRRGVHSFQPMVSLTNRSPSPRKALGQHYLLDQDIVHTIVRSADLAPTDIIVEVGPGPGTLTKPLVAEAGQVVAIEMDPALAAALPRRLGNPSNLVVVNDDARTTDLSQLTPKGDGYKMVSNLPYYAAAPIMRRFLEESPVKPSAMVVMLQKEVAQSILAADGRMSLLAVAVHVYGKPTHVCDVPASAFRPKPKVNSAVIRIDILPSPAVDVDDLEGFFNVVRAGFAAPRKQLRNSLSQGLDVTPRQAGGFLERAGLDPTLRAETLTLDDWAGLHRAVSLLRATEGADGS